MTERSVEHATFVVERTYDAAPARVFAAFADPAVKARWFTGPEDWVVESSEFDFRVGGHERSRSRPAGGPVIAFDCLYQEIVPNERIIYTYDMHLDEARISVSLATLEFKAAAGGTRLICTEQGAYLDGLDTPGQREGGTASLLDALGAVLGREPASV